MIKKCSEKIYTRFHKADAGYSSSPPHRVEGAGREGGGDGESKQTQTHAQGDTEEKYSQLSPTRSPSLSQRVSRRPGIKQKAKNALDTTLVSEDSAESEAKRHPAFMAAHAGSKQTPPLHAHTNTHTGDYLPVRHRIYDCRRTLCRSLRCPERILLDKPSRTAPFPL